MEEPAITITVTIPEKLERVDVEREYLRAAGEAFSKKAREIEREFIEGLLNGQ